MAMKKQPKPHDLAGHHGQPSGHKIVHETNPNKRSVPTFKKDAPSHGHIKEGNLTANHSQPQGHSIGTSGRPNPMKSTGAKSVQTGYGVFTPPSMSGADCFRGTNKKGVLRVSGSKGAHMVGCRKK